MQLHPESVRQKLSLCTTRENIWEFFAQVLCESLDLELLLNIGKVIPTPTLYFSLYQVTIIVLPLASLISPLSSHWSLLCSGDCWAGAKQSGQRQVRQPLPVVSIFSQTGDGWIFYSATKKFPLRFNCCKLSQYKKSAHTFIMVNRNWPVLYELSSLMFIKVFH